MQTVNINAPKELAEFSGTWQVGFEYHFGTPNATICIVRQVKPKLDKPRAGVAILNPKEMFDVKVGHKIALVRAIRTLWMTTPSEHRSKMLSRMRRPYGVKSYAPLIDKALGELTAKFVHVLELEAE